MAKISWELKKRRSKKDRVVDGSWGVYRNGQLVDSHLSKGVAGLSLQALRAASLRLPDAASRVLDRMASKDESIEQAIYWVAEDFDGSPAFRAILLAYLQGKR